MDPTFKTVLFIVGGTIGVAVTVLALTLAVLWLSTFFVPGPHESNEDIADDADDDMYGGPDDATAL